MAELTPAQIAFLETRRVAHLATIDDAGAPHVVPVCFACVDSLLYTPIDEKPKRVAAGALRRIRNIQAHPEVCLVWDHYEEDWSRLAWLQVRGRAALVTNADERARALAALRLRYPQYRKMDLESRPLIQITPARILWWASAPRH